MLHSISHLVDFKIQDVDGETNDEFEIMSWFCLKFPTPRSLMHWYRAVDVFFPDTQVANTIVQ